MLKSFIGLSLTAIALISILGNVNQEKESFTLLGIKNQINRIQMKKNVPSIVTKGFEEFCSKHTRNPVEVWAERSTMINETTGTVMDAMFKNILGKCIDYSIIGSVPITEKTQIVYVESEHINSPFFWQITVHRSHRGEVISGFNSHTNIGELLTPSLVMKR